MPSTKPLLVVVAMLGDSGGDGSCFCGRGSAKPERDGGDKEGWGRRWAAPQGAVHPLNVARHSALEAPALAVGGIGAFSRGRTPTRTVVLPGVFVCLLQTPVVRSPCQHFVYRVFKFVGPDWPRMVRCTCFYLHLGHRMDG